VQVPAQAAGVLTSVDVKALTSAAGAADVVILSELRLGDYVPEGAPLCEVVGDPDGLDLVAVSAAFVLGKERTMQQDVAFGFRQLVDIAEKALSPGINDPTTAVQALDELHDLLRQLAVRTLPDGGHRDEAGRLRLLLPAESLEDYLALALDEIEQYGADTIQVQQKLRRLLTDLRSAALPEHRPALDARLGRLIG
jgi:uncharacterized membrane protein